MRTPEHDRNLTIWAISHLIAIRCETTVTWTRARCGPILYARRRHRRPPNRRRRRQHHRMLSFARPAWTMLLGSLLLATPTAAWSEPPWGAATSTLPQRDLGKCSGLSTLVRLQRLCPLLACLPSSHVVLLAPLSLPSQQCHDQTSPNGLCAIARDCRLDEVDRLSVVVLLSRGPSGLWRSAELGTRGGRGALMLRASTLSMSSGGGPRK